MNETAEAPLFNQGALSINGDVHVGGRDGAAQLVRGAQMEALGPQGMIASMGQDAEGAAGSGSTEPAGDHWTKGFTDQYGGDAQTRQVALADVKGPGTEYLRELSTLATGDVSYGAEAELLDVQHQEVTKQAGVLTKAAIAIASGGNAWLSFGLNTAADGIISGEINLENVVKDAAFTAFTAGVDIGGVQFDGVTKYAGDYANTLGLSSQSVLGPRAGDLLSANSMTTGLIDATATGLVQTGLYGGNLGDNILDNAGSFASNQAMAVGFYGAGDFKAIHDLKTGSAGAIAAHMFAGCAGGALTGAGCGEGAFAAGVNEFGAGQGWNTQGRKAANLTVAVLLSHGDPNALGQLSGVTATADRYNRQLHEYEEERLTELKAGKTDEEKHRLDAAACYLIRCAAGIPKDDPDYTTTAAMQEIGAGYQEEIDLLREQSREQYSTWLPVPLSPSTYQDALFTYTGKDEWRDRQWQNGNFVRAEGVLMAAGGLSEAMVAAGVCLRGSCTVINGIAYAQSTDYMSAGAQQGWTGKSITPLGELTLQGFGLSPEMAGLIYSSTAIVAAGTVAAGSLRTGTIADDFATKGTVPNGSAYSQAYYDAYVQRKLDAGETPRSPEDYVQRRQQLDQNRADGARRQAEYRQEMADIYGEENVLTERYLRDADGSIVRDPDTGEARRLDCVVVNGQCGTFTSEVTSPTANKADQIEKEERIREQGGTFVENPNTGELIEVPLSRVERIE